MEAAMEGGVPVEDNVRECQSDLSPNFGPAVALVESRAGI